MATPTSSERAAFSLDVPGRYAVNGLDEALHSADRVARQPDGSPRNDARPFDIVVLGGGTFGAIDQRPIQAPLYASVRARPYNVCPE